MTTLALTCLLALAPQSAEASAARALPEDALLVLEAPGLPGLLERGLDDPAVRRILSSEVGALLTAELGAEPRQALAGLDAWLGFPVLDTAAQACRRGAAFGLWADRDVRWALVLWGQDGDATLAAVERLLELSGADPDPSWRPQDARAWDLGDSVLGLRGSALVLADGRGSLERVLERCSGAPPAAPRKGAPLLAGHLDAGRVRALERAEGTDEGLSELAHALRQPEGPFLLGTTLCTLLGAERWEWTVDLRGDELRARVTGRGTDPGPAARLLPGPGEHAVPPPPLQGALATATVHRDAAAIFEHRAELFGPEYAGSFAKAIGDLALFFGGADLSEDVLPHVSPWLRLIAAPVAHDPAATPEIALPAAALVAEIDDPEHTAPRLMAAFQTLIGILNLERAQQGGDAMVLELARAGEHALTWAHFPPPQPGEGVDLRYNLVPACAQVGRWLVLSTHRDLAERVVRALDEGEPVAASPWSEFVTLDGDVAAGFLEENREALIAHAMLAEGKTREKATGDVRGLTALARLLDSARLSIECSGDAPIELELAVALAATEADR